MNRIHISYTAVAVFLSSCAGVPGGENGSIGGSSHINVHPGNTSVVSSPAMMDGREFDAEMISKTTKNADFEFYNACIYKDPEAWKGRTVCVQAKFPGTGPRARQYVQSDREFYLTGEYNSHTIALIVKLDHALPKDGAYDKLVRTVAPQQDIYVFGKLLGLESTMTESGYTRTLPLLQCLLIYDKDDPTFRFPLWASSIFERMPDGTVTTDSLKYEFDMPKKR